jgi:hypothetical protein
MSFEVEIPADASAATHLIVESLVNQWKRVAQQKAVLRKLEMRSLANWGATKLDEILDGGAIPSFMSGGHRVSPTDAFFKYLIDLAIKSPLKAHKPGVRFRKEPRPRTANELRGLVIANRRRAEVAAQRRRVRSEAADA